MKKLLASLIVLTMLSLSALTAYGESLSENARTVYEAIRWNPNLPKQSNVIRAEEYLFKLTKQITLRALLAEVTLSEELEMMYGAGGRLLVIDLDSGELIDYKNFDSDVRWPDEGEVTSKYDGLHLLYSCYWSYLEGYNENIMSEFEFVTPFAEEEIAAINAALNADFIR